MPQIRTIPVIMGTTTVPRVARTHGRFIKTISVRTQLPGKRRTLKKFTAKPGTRGVVRLSTIKKLAPYIGDEKGEKVIYYQKTPAAKRKKVVRPTGINYKLIMTKPRKRTIIKKAVTKKKVTKKKVTKKKVALPIKRKPLPSLPTPSIANIYGVGRQIPSGLQLVNLQ